MKPVALAVVFVGFGRTAVPVYDASVKLADANARPLLARVVEATDSSPCSLEGRDLRS
jgi:hypothetical protein